MITFSANTFVRNAQPVRFGNQQPSRDKLQAAQELVREKLAPTGKLLEYSGQRPGGFDVRAVVGNLGADILLTTRAEVTPEILQEVTSAIGHLTRLESPGRLFEYAPPELAPQTFKLAVVRMQPL